MDSRCLIEVELRIVQLEEEARWADEYFEKHYGAVLARAKKAELEAANWRKLMALGRLRVVGTGGLGKPGQQYLMLELWDRHPDPSPTEDAKEVLQLFLDAATLVQPPEVDL